MANISAVSADRREDGMTMDGMTKHARNLRHAARDDRPPQAHARAAAWLVLAVAGATMVSFNMWHAIHGGIPLPLAILYGIAPVALAMGLSHVVAAYNGGWFMKIVTFVIMLGAMVLSVRATGYVVKPATGNLWPLFGAVVDAAALMALQVILSPESRAAARTARTATRGALLSATLGAGSGAAASAVHVPAEVPSDVPDQVPVPVPDYVPSGVPQQKAVRVSKDPDAKKARDAYRQSVRDGRPLSQAALGAKYNRSKTWGRDRIRECESGPHLTRTGT